MARPGSRRWSIAHPRAIYTTARREPPLALALGDWVYYGVLRFRLRPRGRDRFALWNRYTDWRENQPVGSLDLHFERPSDGTYAEVRGSRINDDDQYYQAVYGQAGRVQGPGLHPRHAEYPVDRCEADLERRRQQRSDVAAFVDAGRKHLR